MTSESTRFHLHNLHQLEDEQPLFGSMAELPSSPAGEEEGNSAAAGDAQFRLYRQEDMVLYQQPGKEPQAVRVLWAKPLSARGGPVSIMQAGKKKEVAYLTSLDQLDPASRKIALEELAGGMILAKITMIFSIMMRFGNYYWDVDTDRGQRRFLLTSPENNHIRPTPDSIVIRDASGNCYEINPVSALDARSLRELDRVL